MLLLFMLLPIAHDLTFLFSTATFVAVFAVVILTFPSSLPSLLYRSSSHLMELEFLHCLQTENVQCIGHDLTNIFFL